MHSKPSLPSPLYRHVELPFDKIMGYLDNPSVLTLGKINHDFNHTALSRILGPTIVDGTLAHSKLVIGHKQPVELLAALCVARWLPAAITSVEYFAARDNIHHFVNDMLRLAFHLSLLPHRCLETLNLEVSVNTTSKSLLECGEKYELVTTLVWTRALSKLVDIALLVGYSQIVIRTNYPPDHQWIDLFPPSPLPSRSFSRQRNISRLFSENGTFILLFTTASTIRLRSLTFATAHIFTSAFLNYTISLFGMVLSTIKELVFASSPDYCHSSSTWAALFQSIHLPHLKPLTFSPNSANIEPCDLFKFLSDHPVSRH